MCRLLCRPSNKSLSESKKWLTRLKTYFLSKGCVKSLLPLSGLPHRPFFPIHSLPIPYRFPRPGLSSNPKLMAVQINQGLSKTRLKTPLLSKGCVLQKVFSRNYLSPAAGAAWSCWLTHNQTVFKAYRLCYWKPTESLELFFNAAMSLVNKWKSRSNRQRLRSLKNIPKQILTWKNQRNQKNSALLTPWESRKVQILPEKKPSLNAYLFECSTQYYIKKYTKCTWKTKIT